MAVAKKEFDFFRLYVCLLGTFALAFCRHVFYVAFWSHVEYTSYNASHGSSISDKPLHWYILELGDGFTQSLLIQCPSNQTKEATPGNTFHPLTFPYPVILSGGNDVTFVQTPMYFQIGLTRVVFTATDSVGNSAECFFHVHLRLPDSIPPSIICPANQTEYLLPGQSSINVTFPRPVHLVDNSGGAVAHSYNPAPGQVFPEGISAITVTATDESGNSESCIFYVIVKPPLDTTPPVLTCPQDELQEVAVHRSGAECHVLVEYQTPTATDDSGNEVIIQSYPSSGGLFDSCTNFNGMKIEVRATDTSGNTASCTFWIRWLEVATTLSAGTTMRPTTTIKATTRAPTTTQPTTTRPSTTTKAPATTRPPPSTTQPTTTRPPTTTKAPATTRPTTTTSAPTTTRPPSTTKSPTTTRPPTTTQQPTTTRPSSTTQPTTTRPSTTTKPTTRPHTTTLPPTTRPSTTTKSPATTKPPTTAKPSQTTRPPTTSKSPSTTRPPTTSGTTRPPTTTRKQTTSPTTKPMTTWKGSTKGRPQPTEFDICNPNPCENDGTCLRDPTNTIFNCVCLAGYDGDTCEINLDITLAPEDSQGVQSLQSAIIAVVIGALAFVLVIFIILTSIICCYNRDGSRTRHSKTAKPSDEVESHKNPVFILDALDPDEDDDKLSLESHELEHIDEQYQAKKDMLAAVTKAQEARTQHVLSNKPPIVKKNVLSNKTPPIAKKNTYIPTVTFAEEAEEHLYDVTPDVMTTDTEHDYDEVSSIHSDHSYESVNEALKKIRVFVETDDLPESERDEAEKEAAVMEEIFNKEGLVRIPSTLSTAHSQMSVKLNKGNLNNRYLHRK